MKYLFTSLAVGETYLDDIVCTHITLSKKFNSDFRITTNIDTDHIDKIYFDVFEIMDYKIQNKFNKNLLVLPLKYSLDKDYEFIIYTNSNVRFRNHFDEKMINRVFQYMRENDYDVYAKSKSIVEDEKFNENTEYHEKLNEYNLSKFKKWDKSFIIDESFMIFKCNWKFKIFVSKFEQYLWYNIMNDIKSHPFGLELGVAMYETGMNIANEQCDEFMKNVVYE